MPDWGSFTSINGTRVRNLARLNADGTLDAGFTARSTANGPVYALALQADGGVLVGGQFDSLATARRRSVGRLLPTGTLDAGFDAGLPAVLDARQVAVLPGGGVLLEPRTVQYYAYPVGELYRPGGQTGQVDASFQQEVMVSCLAVQADGKIVTGGSGVAYNPVYKLARLLPTGRLGPSFASRLTTGVYTSKVVVAPSGVCHLADSPNGYTYSGLTAPDFTSTNWGSLSPTEFAVQPSGRVLVAGRNGSGPGAPLSARLLANGQPGTSYGATAGPVTDATGNGQLLRLLVQPDGAVLMAGSFTRAGTTPVYGLVRLRDANVLLTQSSLAAAGTTVWPVPAAHVLHVQLAPAARPQQVALLDYLGRTVLACPGPAATPVLDLDVAALPAGLYVLRVSYGAEAAPVTRAVVVAR